MTTVFILLDAFRPDYINRTRFIKELSQESSHGSLTPPFGFMSTSGAIFAGLTPEESGLCHKFCLSEEERPFDFIRFFQFITGDPLTPLRGIKKNLASLLVRLIHRNTIISFYGSPEMIPVGLLPFFDFGQKKRPDEEGFVSSPSLFDILRAGQKRYLYLGFARKKSAVEYLRKVISRDVYDEDRYLIERFKKDILECDYDFAYLHLNLLDLLGHAFGPDSVEMENGIEAVDKWMDTLYNFLKDSFSRLNFVLASDHGMCGVRETVNLWDTILKFRFKIGTDFIPFLDATQARFWGREDVIDCIRGILAEAKGGRFLNENDVTRFCLRFRDNRYGDLFWVCDEGVAIAPNFFEEAPPKGTHGYIPGSGGDSAFFLINRNGLKGREIAGDLKDLFFSLLRLMDLPVPTSCYRILF